MLALFTWANLGLIFKYLPQLIELCKSMESTIEGQITEIKVKRAKDQIEIAFKVGKTPAQSAQELNDVFKN